MDCSPKPVAKPASAVAIAVATDVAATVAVATSATVAIPRIVVAAVPRTAVVATAAAKTPVAATVAVTKVPAAVFLELSTDCEAVAIAIAAVVAVATMVAEEATTVAVPANDWPVVLPVADVVRTPADTQPATTLLPALSRGKPPIRTTQHGDRATF